MTIRTERIDTPLNGRGGPRGVHGAWSAALCFYANANPVEGRRCLDAISRAICPPIPELAQLCAKKLRYMVSEGFTPRTVLGHDAMSGAAEAYANARTPEAYEAWAKESTDYFERVVVGSISGDGACAMMAVAIGGTFHERDSRGYMDDVNEFTTHCPSAGKSLSPAAHDKASPWCSIIAKCYEFCWNTHQLPPEGEIVFLGDMTNEEFFARYNITPEDLKGVSVRFVRSDNRTIAGVKVGGFFAPMDWLVATGIRKNKEQKAREAKGGAA